jgi:hypothetical protein
MMLRFDCKMNTNYDIECFTKAEVTVTAELFLVKSVLGPVHKNVGVRPARVGRLYR